MEETVYPRLRLAFILVLIALMVVVAGCGAKDTLTSIQDRFAGDQEEQGTISSLPPIPQGFSSADMEIRQVTLYFADPTGKFLVAETRGIPKVEGIARATMQELTMGPAPSSSLLPTVPVGTYLKDINIKPDGLAIVDFSRELISNSEISGELAVYSIVNTLSDFPTVNRVKILIDGMAMDNLGNVDISEALAPKEDLVQVMGGTTG